LIENPAGELCSDVEPDRPEVVDVVEGVGSPGSKGEEVVEGELLCGGEVFRRRVLVVGAAEIHVSGRACGRVEAEVERECPFQDPAVGRRGDQTTEEQLKGDALPEAGDAKPGRRRLGLEPVVESLAEGSGGRVSH
jgi:hypothetical protein